MIRRTALVLVAGALACALGSCSRTRADAAARLVVTGSSTMAPLVAEIARRFERERPGVRIDVQTGGSSRGIADVGRGVADVGMSSRALFEEESPGIEAHLLARDGVGFVIHADNPARGLDDDALRRIATGAVRNWRVLGGEDAAIVFVSRADGRSELPLVLDHFGIGAGELRPSSIAGESQQALKLVAGNRHAISFVSIGSAEAEIARGARLRLLPLGGVEASSRAVGTGEYPLSRPLLLLQRPGARGVAADFVAYATSPRVRDLVIRHAFVPVR